jgi:hypothetical protein
MKNFKIFIASESFQPLLHVASDGVCFLNASIRPWDDGDFDASRGGAPENDLRRESATQPTGSWEWELREAFKQGALTTAAVSIEAVGLTQPCLDWPPTTASCWIYGLSNSFWSRRISFLGQSK